MKPTKRTIARRLWISIGVAIGVGLSLSIVTFFFLRQWAHRETQLNFNMAVSDRVYSLQREIENNIEVLRSIHSFFNSNGHVTREEFHTFCKPTLSRHPDIQALEWIPRVPHSQREDYEKNAQVDGYSDFQITKREAQGKMVRADESKEYFPVYYMEPYKGNELALGFDLATNPARLEALSKSRDTGEMVATSRITLVQEKGNQSGFLVFLPVYRNEAIINTVEERRENLIGFVLGVFRVGDIVETSLTYLEKKGIDICLFDQSSSQDEESLYTHLSGRRGDRDQSIMQQEAKYDDALHVSRTIDVADRKWLMVCTSTPELFEQGRTFYPWGLLFGGLLFTGLVVVYTKTRTSQTMQVEQLVSKLSAEITERKRGEQIKASLNEKEVLLREIHHRVKNNLQVISSLLDMSSMRADNQEGIDLFTDARNRINTMALIHSELYQSGQFNRINMEDYIQKLAKDLVQIYATKKLIALDVKPSDVYLSVTQAIPCALVLNELISNALKHAYREEQKGTLEISIQRLDERTIFVRVRDDGVGLPREIDIYRVNSLGLKLVRNLVQGQLKGQIQVNRNKGTEFIVKFATSEGDKT
ncbi:MAG: CHASE domain-containing protein [Candidatus Brocadiales bacterium]